MNTNDSKGRIQRKFDFQKRWYITLSSPPATKYWLLKCMPPVAEESLRYSVFSFFVMTQLTTSNILHSTVGALLEVCVIKSCVSQKEMRSRCLDPLKFFTTCQSLVDVSEVKIYDDRSLSISNRIFWPEVADNTVNVSLLYDWGWWKGISMTHLS